MVATHIHIWTHINMFKSPHVFSGNICASFLHFPVSFTFALHNNSNTPIYPAIGDTPPLDNKTFLTAHSLAYSHSLAVQMSTLALFCGCFLFCMTSFSAKQDSAHSHMHTFTSICVYKYGQGIRTFLLLIFIEETCVLICACIFLI